MNSLGMETAKSERGEEKNKNHRKVAVRVQRKEESRKVFPNATHTIAISSLFFNALLIPSLFLRVELLLLASTHPGEKNGMNQLQMENEALGIARFHG